MPTRTVKKTAVVASAQAAVDWNKEFRSSTDYFAFVSKAAKKAVDGDGRAAFYVSKILGPCLVMARLYGGKADPEEAFNEAMATQAFNPSWLVDKERKEFRACAGFLKGDAFADLPKRAAGYNSPRYWSDMAYQNNDPIAQTAHAASEIGSPISPNPGSIEIAQSDISHAIASGDPEAIFRAGSIISNGLYVDRIEGYALSLAACDLGYDCSANNTDDIIFANCAAAGTCQAGAVFSDVVTKAIGPDGYAQAYARAQQIEDALTRDDTSALQQFSQLKR